MTNREIIIDAFKKKGAMKAGELAEATGLDKKIVDKELDSMKKENLIVSPKRCYWTINE
ncbi:MAG: ArsR family transcriptional regulator [Bacteroidales bacterium]|nr:ArsR family transcriptional regulator [Bacteroidales bacterium]